MFCQKCGNQLPDGSVSCNFCGAPQQNAPQPQFIQQPPMQQQFIQPPMQQYAQPPVPPQKNNNKTVLIAVIAALVVIIGVLVGVFVIKPMLDKDKEKETTTVAATEEPKVETPTNPPAPAVTNDDAETAVDEYLSQIDSKQILAAIGQNSSVLFGSDEDIILEVCDTFLYCNKYSVGQATKISDTKFEVSVDFNVYTDYQTTINKIIAEKNSRDVPASESDYMPFLIDVIDTALRNNFDIRTTHIATLTAEYVNGQWTVTLTKDVAESLLGCALTFVEYVSNM